MWAALLPNGARTTLWRDQSRDRVCSAPRTDDRHRARSPDSSRIGAEPIERENLDIQAADHQKCRGLDLVERRRGHVRPPTPRDDRTNGTGRSRGCDQSGRGAGTDTEITERLVPQRVVPGCPVGCDQQSFGQETNVEDVGAISRFLIAEKVKQHSQSLTPSRQHGCCVDEDGRGGGRFP